MKQVIDLDNWNRKEHFAFFSAFDDPFFGVQLLWILLMSTDKVKNRMFLFSFIPFISY